MKEKYISRSEFEDVVLNDINKDKESAVTGLNIKRDPYF